MIQHIKTSIHHHARWTIQNFAHSSPTHHLCASVHLFTRNTFCDALPHRSHIVRGSSTLRFSMITQHTGIIPKQTDVKPSNQISTTTHVGTKEEEWSVWRSSAFSAPRLRSKWVRRLCCCGMWSGEVEVLGMRWKGSWDRWVWVCWGWWYFVIMGKLREGTVDMGTSGFDM